MLKAVFFDLDNTLIDRDMAVRKYVYHLLHRIRPGDSGATRGALLERIMACDEHGYTPRSQWCCDTVEIIGPPGITPEDLWRDFNDRLLSHLPLSPIVPNLRRLSQNFKTALISNGSSSMQRAKLRAAGLADVFSRPLISQEVGICKPDERLFRRALTQAGVEPEEALMVGDDPRRDIDPAAKIGITTCWISLGRSYPAHAQSPAITFASIAEFFRVVEGQSLLSSISSRQMRNPIVGVM